MEIHLVIYGHNDWPVWLPVLQFKQFNSGIQVSQSVNMVLTAIEEVSLGEQLANNRLSAAVAGAFRPGADQRNKGIFLVAPMLP